jgi:hypothetical protein
METGSVNKSGLGPLNLDEFDSPFDIFSAPRTQTLIEDGRSVFYQPISPIVQDTDIEFLISPTSSYIDMRFTRLHGKMKVMKVVAATGELTPTVAADDYSCVNLFPASAFKLVSTTFNGTEVNDVSTYSYGYKSFIENTLSYSKNIRDTFMKTSCMFIDDGTGKETADKKSVADSGYLTRHALITESKSLDFCIPLNVDIFNCIRLLVPGVTMRIKLTPADANFPLISAVTTNTYKIQFTQLSLEVRAVDLSPAATEKNAAVMLKQPALYPFSSAKITNFVISPLVQSTIVQNVVVGELPSLLLVGFVASENFNSSIKKNPFHFAPHGISQLFFRVNGTHKPAKPYTPNFADKDCLREYLALVDTLALDGGCTIPLTKDRFQTGLTFFALDTSGHLGCNNSVRHQPKHGSIDVSVSFKAANEYAIHMLVYSVRNKILAIDHLRNVVIV